MATKSVETNARRARRSQPALEVLLPPTSPRIEFRYDHLSFRIARENDLDRANEAQTRPYATTQQLKKKIAIVDDESSLCRAYSMVVKSLGHETGFVAHDGVEAVKAVSETATPPDLIVMDYRMPLMDGLEAAKQILKDKPGIKIIIASADDSVKPAVQARGLYYLHKPFSTSSLEDLIKSAIER